MEVGLLGELVLINNKISMGDRKIVLMMEAKVQTKTSLVDLILTKFLEDWWDLKKILPWNLEVPDSKTKITL